MASFNLVNYSLRPSKSIQRSLVFEGARSIQDRLGLGDFVYAGMGSIWFTDFTLAHRVLRVAEMFSVESDEIGFSRARFNSPYKSVEVRQGFTDQVLPQILASPSLQGKPWMVWLDYDKELSAQRVAEVRMLVEKLPPNSLFVVTFNSVGHKYGKPKDRTQTVRDLLGAVVPDDWSQDQFDDESLPTALSTLMLDFMVSAAVDSGRSAGMIPCFRMAYRDGAPMVTVGGFLPDAQSRQPAEQLIDAEGWLGLSDKVISAPHLTMREVLALQGRLPSDGKLSREEVRGLGFDLEDEEIAAFERYYRFYPNFAQVVS